MGELTVKEPLGFSPLMNDIGPPNPSGFKSIRPQGQRGSSQAAIFRGEPFIITGSNLENVWQVRYRKVGDATWLVNSFAFNPWSFAVDGLVINYAFQGDVVPFGNYQFQVQDMLDRFVDVPGTLKICTPGPTNGSDFYLQRVGAIAWAYTPGNNISAGAGFSTMVPAMWTDHNAPYNLTIMNVTADPSSNIPNTSDPAHLDQFDSCFIDLPWEDVDPASNVEMFFLQQTSTAGGFTPEVGVASQECYQLLDRHPGPNPPWSPLDNRYSWRAFFRLDSGRDLRNAEPGCVYKMVAVVDGNKTYDFGNIIWG